MTLFRAWVRRGLIARPITQEVLDGCEMDWLALTMDNSIGRYIENGGQEGHPEIPSDLPSYTWMIATGTNNLALRDSWAGSDTPDVAEGQGVDQGQTANEGPTAPESQSTRHNGDYTKGSEG